MMSGFINSYQAILPTSRKRKDQSEQDRSVEPHQSGGSTAHCPTSVEPASAGVQKNVFPYHSGRQASASTPSASPGSGQGRSRAFQLRPASSDLKRPRLLAA